MNIEVLTIIVHQLTNDYVSLFFLVLVKETSLTQTLALSSKNVSTTFYFKGSF